MHFASGCWDARVQHAACNDASVGYWMEHLHADIRFRLAGEEVCYRREDGGVWESLGYFGSPSGGSYCLGSQIRKRSL